MAEQKRIFTPMDINATVMKESIFGILCPKISNIRIVIATTAFRIHLDIPDICQIIHVALPNEIKMCVQRLEEVGKMDYHPSQC